MSTDFDLADSAVGDHSAEWEFGQTRRGQGAAADDHPVFADPGRDIDSAEAAGKLLVDATAHRIAAADDDDGTHERLQHRDRLGERIHRLRSVDDGPGLPHSEFGQFPDLTELAHGQHGGRLGGGISGCTRGLVGSGQRLDRRGQSPRLVEAVVVGAHLRQTTEQGRLQTVRIIDEDQVLGGLGREFGGDEGAFGVTARDVEDSEAASNDVVDEHAGLRQAGHVDQLWGLRQQVPAALDGGGVRGQQGGGHSISLIRSDHLPPPRPRAAQPSAS